MNIRKNYVQGQFYPDSAHKMDELMKKLIEKENIDYSFAEKEIIGGIVPHAGYIYSGYQAIHFFELLKETQTRYDTFVIINPNHTGLGEAISLTPYEYWDSIYGKVEVDLEFQKFLDFPCEGLSQLREHSGEVMIPFLKYALDYNFKIVPICFKNQNCENAKLIAKNIKTAVEKSGKNICIIASSDFSHFLEATLGEKLDKEALEKICNLNSKDFYELVYEKDLSICGFGPIMVLMEYAKLITNKPKTKILKRGNSGEITGDFSKVVQYCSVLFYK